MAEIDNPESEAVEASSPRNKAARSAHSGGTHKSTIFDVAARAGVSIKTVSRVVNNEPNVSEKTREKVQAAVTTLNYQPNAAARGLSSKRSYVIGLIYENAHEFSYTKDVLDGALASCERNGFTLLLRPLTLPNSAVEDQVRSFVVQAAVEGVLLPAPVGDLPGVQRVLRERQLPYATITPKLPPDDGLNVFCDDGSAVEALVLHLVELGHSKIGFIKGHPDHRASDDRYAGYCKALQDHGIAVEEKWVESGLFTFDSGKAAARNLLDSSEPPTAIIASNDDMAGGVLFEARERGLQVPHDLSVAGFDDTPIAAQTWPPLTTVRQPISEMALSLTNALIQKVGGQPSELSSAPFGCEVVIRGSTAKPGH